MSETSRDKWRKLWGERPLTLFGTVKTASAPVTQEEREAMRLAIRLLDLDPGLSREEAANEADDRAGFRRHHVRYLESLYAKVCYQAEAWRRAAR